MIYNMITMDGGITPSGTISISANGDYDVSAFASASVNVPTGGISFDDIAMRTVSGSATGSATGIGNYAFSGCSVLTNASFPNATSIGNHAFSGCSALTNASFPNATSIGSYAFNGCSALTNASFPNVISIGNYAFSGCRELFSFYLLGSSIPTLANATAFYNTPISISSGGMYGSIFVPASLYDSYVSATNWSAYSARFVSV